eukprot:CAMPEP_0168171032 /NCGR_PEP_ID=MMETSP0139_2-20121125/4493_1 /TAXON_ID=44445 /ORGANISM="Pseudo-nitzschia australis, Strain 10249 10 AB" /LENGTH=365 /DNA_ID=CAMNT_0008088567 /DNA_START=73 /DNA_END=1170 /DNA_ORIENTATION=-
MANKDDVDEESSLESSDEALLDMLGLSSLKEVSVAALSDDDEEKDGEGGKSDVCINEQPTGNPSNIPILSDVWLNSNVRPLAKDQYPKESIFKFPEECSVSGKHMRIMTEEIVWGSGPNNTKYQSDRSYEGIKIWKNGEIEERKTLTRLENFVDDHPGWSELCHGYLRRILSAALGVEMVLFKEKLNLKPPGGSGFAPHLDSPSLRMALGSEGPKTFCTVMVAIDDMTKKNGCLRICKGNWTEENCCGVIQPDKDGNPDAGGRAGAIPPQMAENLEFEDLICKGGSISVFNGWCPHRSAANLSPFPRRVILLTYNPKDEGDFHKKYYERMEQLRNEWRVKLGLLHRKQRLGDEKIEMEALSSVPK